MIGIARFHHHGQADVLSRFPGVIGVVVRIIMEKNGWRTTGRKGSLGVRAKVLSRTTTVGAYHNVGGLALWFTRSERYERAAGLPFRSVELRAAEIEAAAGVMA